MIKRFDFFLQVDDFWKFSDNYVVTHILIYFIIYYPFEHIYFHILFYLVYDIWKILLYLSEKVDLSFFSGNAIG